MMLSTAMFPLIIKRHFVSSKFKFYVELFKS